MSNPPGWLLHHPRNDAPTRLFVLPYSGVGASIYGRWPRSFGPAEVCLVQFPGRENRLGEPHYGTYQRLAAMMAEALEPYLDRPYGVFGHCSAALPAFALALHLMCAGQRPPDRLFMSSQVAPHENLSGRRLVDISDDGLAAPNRATDGKPQSRSVEMDLGMRRADIAANRAYRLAQPVLVPSVIHAICWDADTHITPEQMRDGSSTPHRADSALLCCAAHKTHSSTPHRHCSAG